MIRKQLIIVAVSVLLILISISCGANEVRKAKKLIEDKMFPEAIILLEKAIKKTLNDPETNYLLGLCYIQTGNIKKADRYFSNAIMNNRNLKIKIDQTEISNLFYQEGNISTTVMGKFEAFNLALKYHDIHNKEIYEYLFNELKSKDHSYRNKFLYRLDTIVKDKLNTMLINYDSLIDNYRIEIAIAIQKNWNQQYLSGKANASDKAIINFKILPNGQFVDLIFKSPSGNKKLDEYVTNTIIATSLIKPHPNGVEEQFILVQMNFTLKGIQ